MLRQEDCYDKESGAPLAMIGFYKPTESQKIATDKDQNFYVKFGKFLKDKEFDKYNTFIILKPSIRSKLKLIEKTFNFFEYQYDTEYEVLTAYLQVKHIIDAQQGYLCDMDTIINLIYDILFTESICKKIRTMVEENYLDDIEKGNTNKKVFTESLEFNNRHIRSILAISTAIKFIAPIANHYIAQVNDKTNNNIQINKGSDTFYYFYRPALTIFGEDCDIYNKLYVYVNKMINQSYKTNSLTYEQRGILGTSIPTIVDDFIRHEFIGNIFINYKFTESWDKRYHRYAETVVGMNKAVIQRQLYFFRMMAYQADLATVGTDPNDENIRGIDKMSIYMNYNNEGLAQCIEIGIEEMTRSIIFTNASLIQNEEEIDYYVDHWNPTEDQLQLIYAFYAKYFGDAKYCELIPKKNLVKLALILKKILLIDYIGRGKEGEFDYKQAVLPYILLSTMIPSSSNRIVYSDELIKNIKETYLYQSLEKKYAIMIQSYENKKEKENNILLELIINILCARYELLDFYHPDKRGTLIEFNHNRLSYELLSFLNNI